MAAPVTIDLTPFYGTTESGNPVLVLVGREKGRLAREQTRFDDLLLKFGAERIDILLKPNTRSVNPSFLEEFIKNGVEHLGKKQFLDKVHFSKPEIYDISNDLETSIERVERHILA